MIRKESLPIKKDCVIIPKEREKRIQYLELTKKLLLKSIGSLS